MLKRVFVIVGICTLFYTRLVGLNWGLPYPMHPDERNMATAVQNLNCDISNFKFQISNCLNPHFFAYGQFPLYLAYGTVGVMKFFNNTSGTPIGFEEATMALRLISAAASILNVFVLLKIIDFIRLKFKIKNFNFSLPFLIFNFALLTFSPYFIQFSHFGTTESLLMLFYSLIVYLSLKLLTDHQQPITNNYFLAFICGLAVATKVSSIVFLILPIIILFFCNFYLQSRQVATNQGIPTRAQPKRALAGKDPLTESVDFFFNVIYIVKFLLLVIIVTILFSPQTFISFPKFLSSLSYESSVAMGQYIAFYTRQFVGSPPILFQLLNIFPYALGWPQFVLALLGIVFLTWKNKYINMLRFAFLVYFIPTAFVFAKWSRFMAPIFPIMSMFAILFIYELMSTVKNQRSKIQVKGQRFQTFNFLLSLLPFAFLLLILIPGLTYLSIYQTPDVRFKASQWIYANIPEESKILSETANVVDIPIPSTNYQLATKNYQLISFNFYDLDSSPALQRQLQQYVKEADYIFVPSRRIFANHTYEEYPILNKYYTDLVSGKLGFEKVAEFSSYPKIELFGKTLLDFPDEAAEETWSVFDHPVIRVYKKNSNVKTQNSNVLRSNSSQIQNLKNYKTINFQLSTFNFQLLVADTPSKWEQGLMFVRNKQDIGGLDGMIFLFPNSNTLSFWNKNTVTDLDLYWINDDKVVSSSFLPSIEKSGQIVTVSSPKEVNKVVEIIK